MHFVDLGESFPTHIFLQNLASIQQRTSLVKFLVRKSFSVVVRQQAETLVLKVSVDNNTRTQSREKKNTVGNG